MEIKYTEFNRLFSVSLRITGVMKEAFIVDFLENGQVHKLNSVQKDNVLRSLDREEKRFQNVFISGLKMEIMNNLADLENDLHVGRYLNKLLHFMEIQYRYLTLDYNYAAINQSKFFHRDNEKSTISITKPKKCDAESYKLISLSIVRKIRRLNEYEKLLDFIKIEINKVTPETKKLPQKPTIPPVNKVKKVYLNFEQLFNIPYVEHIDKFIQILRDVNPPLLNDNLKWTVNKGAARVYFETLLYSGVIKDISYKEAGVVLQDRFGVNASNVEINPHKLFKTTPKVYSIYKEPFSHEIEIIKNDIKNLKSSQPA